MRDEKRLKEMEEEYQELMYDSNGVQTEEIKDLGRRIDGQKEDIKLREIEKKSLQNWSTQSKCKENK